MNILNLCFLLFIIIGLIILLIVFSQQRKKHLVKSAMGYRLLQILMPKTSPEEASKKKPAEFISLFDQLLGSLANYKNPLFWEMAVPTDSDQIEFYVAAPRKDVDLIIKQINGFFPDAEIEPSKDYTIFQEQGATVGAVLTLREDYSVPLRSYQELENDPLNSLSSALERVVLGKEGAAIQLVTTPASSESSKYIQSALKLLREGKTLKDIKGESVSQILAKSLLDNRSAEQIDKDKQEKEKNKVIDQGLIEIVQKKLNRPLLAANIRVVASAETLARAEDIVDSLTAGFSQFMSANSNSFKITKWKSHEKALKGLVYNFVFRLPDWRQILILNSAELAGLWHFPLPCTETPSIKWLRAKAIMAPNNLAKDGGIILGENMYRGAVTPVRLLDSDRGRHVYVIGQTGVGKTTLLKQMIIQDIEQGKGVCYIDPHGDDAEDILAHIPKERAQDVIVFNPADNERPIGLNFLEINSDRPEEKNFVINELLSIIGKIYDLKTTGGPIFEQYFRNTLLLLLSDSKAGYTLMEVVRVLTNPDFRHYLLLKCNDPLVKEFWIKEAEKAGGDFSLANMAPYINSKLSPFLSNELIKYIVGQSHSTIDFREIMDHRKILIVKLSKGLIGDINSQILGMIIVGRILMAAFARADMEESQRQDFNLYLDEFQNITTDSVATILSEARKYHLNLTIAHQYIGQLTENIRNAVFGNVGSLVTYRVGPMDTEVLLKEFGPIINAYDLVNLDNFKAYTRLMVNNTTTEPFSLNKMFKPKPGNPTLAKLM
ncbi:MAG TPA: type IV secretion system DNA-binding domain-containing protein, partial [Candidatus Paceibacterota bacterium]|nr:type IV secretion system DNA-binding domain-containing protein [Candidatus Paceibacterota bacterium]